MTYPPVWDRLLRLQERVLNLESDRDEARRRMTNAELLQEVAREELAVARRDLTRLFLCPTCRSDARDRVWIQGCQKTSDGRIEMGRGFHVTMATYFCSDPWHRGAA